MMVRADPKIATPGLTKALKDEDVAVRELAVEVIGRINVPQRPPAAKAEPVVGDEIFQKVNDDLKALLPKEGIEITRVNRTADGYWEAEGKGDTEALIQQVVASMKASSKFNTPNISPKIQSVSRVAEGGRYVFTFKLSFPVRGGVMGWYRAGWAGGGGAFWLGASWEGGTQRFAEVGTELRRGIGIFR